MPHYIVLGNFTDEGTRNIRDLPRLRDETNKQLEAASGSRYSASTPWGSTTWSP